MKHISFLLTAYLTLAVTPGNAGAETFLEGYQGPYRGQVLDADTKEPMVGAVVVAVWRHVRILPLQRSTVFYAVREVLTETDGVFVLHAKELEDRAPQRTLPPYFQIFFPGYAALRSLAFTKRGFQQGTFEGAGITVGLPRLPTREERREQISWLNPFSLSHSPFRDIPNYVRLVNVERRAIGLQPYPMETQP